MPVRKMRMPDQSEESVAAARHARRMVVIVAGLLLCSLGVMVAAAQTPSVGPVGRRDEGDVADALTIAGVQLPAHERADVNLYGVYLARQEIKGFLAETPVLVQKRVRLTPGYFFIAVPGGVREHRLRLDGRVRFAVKRVEFEDRNLFERRFRTGPDSWRYRHRLRADVPLPGAGGVRLFGYAEPFYDLAARRWTRSLFAAGANKRLPGGLIVEAGYLRQSDRGRADMNAFMLNLVVRLKGFVPSR